MKKFALVLCLFCGFLLCDAMAYTCDIDSRVETGQFSLQIVGMSGGILCKTGACGNGTTVYILENALLDGEKRKVGGVFSCEIRVTSDWLGLISSEDNKWLLLNEVNTCDRTDLFATSATNAKPFLVVNGEQIKDKYYIAKSGESVCRAYVCNEGYKNRNGNCKKKNSKCTTTDNAEKVIGDIINSPGCTAKYMNTPLESRDNLALNAVCDATCAKDGWNITLRETGSCEEGYAPDAGKKRCVETEEHRKQERQKQNAETACTQSGGNWNETTCNCDSNKNLKLEGNKCVCTDDNYEFVKSAMECKMTDVAERRNACEQLAGGRADGEPKWDDDNKTCVCMDNKYEFKSNACQMKADADLCDRIGDAAKWDGTKCVCNDKDKEPHDNGNGAASCVDSQATIQRRENDAARKESEPKIKAAAEKIKNLSQGLGVSVWKDREGNFNKSRLVSDSVAGVVLGTAGGLITSNVVKKNQIKGGFENIGCSIGGQVVAGYGDVFQVGVQ